MQRTAGDIMVTDFPFVDCDVTVSEAEECFERGGLNALPVLNPDRTVFGLLTPRDFARFYRRPDNNPRAAHAWEICDARPLLGAPSDALRDVAAALLMAETRHALIVNEDRQLAGVVTTEMLLESEFALDGGAVVSSMREAVRRPT